MNNDVIRHSRAAELGILSVFLLLAGTLTPAYGQQFNTGNYWTAPHGVVTFFGSAGQYYSSLYVTAALFPRWEFTLGEILYDKEPETNSPNHFSVSAYVKHMVYENEAKTGGWAVMGGTGIKPGYLQAGKVTHNFRDYWLAAPVTIPFLDNTLSWDIMPGLTTDTEYGAEKKTSWGLTYSTRMAINKVIPQSAIVGELFGTEGGAYSKPQFKAGIRWEPSKHWIVAATYGSALDGTRGAGFELGVMILTPAFLCFGECR